MLRFYQEQDNKPEVSLVPEALSSVSFLSNPELVLVIPEELKLVGGRPKKKRKESDKMNVYDTIFTIIKAAHFQL